MHVEASPYWGVIDVLLWIAGMGGLVYCLYQLVLKGLLSASAAGLITDIPGQFGLLYGVLRLRYKRSPWRPLGWIAPLRP